MKWLASPWSVRAALAVLVGLIATAPWLLPVYPLFVLSLALVNIIAVQGVNLVMGYAGQVSLGHAGFAAIGAYTTALLVVHLGWPFWVALVIGGAAAAVLGYLLGFPALRLGPLYVAMVTFGFGLAIMLIAQNWYELTNGPNGIVVPAPVLFGRDLMAPDLHIPIVGITVLLFILARNLVHSRQGRAFVAIRESELAAQAMGVNLARYKTVAFALGAFYAGIAGGLFTGLSEFVNPDAFIFNVSILYVIMALLGGLGYLAGPAIGGLMLTVLPELLRGTAEYKDFLTGLLLLLLLIFLPKGIMGFLDRRLRKPVLDAPLRPHELGHGVPEGVARIARSARASGSLLEVEGVGIAFGGLSALRDVSFGLQSDEILGLIGPNGAGKTTLFNLISGIYRSGMGRILLDGRDISRLPAHRRARLGISRTFQNLEVFGDMSVLDNVLVGAHARIAGRLLQTGLRTPAERREESELRADAAHLLEFVGLTRYADHPASSLAFGHQRMLEIARALAARPRLLLLDEPAAGLTAAEMEFLMRLVRLIREELGIAVLLIGHTMRVVMGLSDRVIVLDHGEMIADGAPADVQGNPRVIEAYLGAEDA